MKANNKTKKFILSLFFLLLVIFANTGVNIPIQNNIKFNFNAYTIDSGNLYSESPDCIKMFMSIKKHATEYDIPIRYAFGIAWAETRYYGPLHWEYNPKQESPVGALGPMQIMPATAKLIWGVEIPRDKLISDIDFNVETSMKLLRRLYDKHGDWQIVFGCYNTGRPMINGYARKVYNFKI